MNKDARPRPSFPAKLDSLSKPSLSALRSPKPPLVHKPGLQPTIAASLRPDMGLDSEAVRRAMVQKLQVQGLRHANVAHALMQVPRHQFVDSGLAAQAYEDTSLPIGLEQTISKPSVVARQLELLLGGQARLQGRVLEIGTGCGYQAALLSMLADEVYSIERLRALHEKAIVNLRPFRLPNVHLILGDGMLGYARGGPYVGIVCAAGGEDVPATWLSQLAVGGRLVAPVVTDGGQRLVVVQRTQHGYERVVHEGVKFVPLKSGLA